MFRTVFTEAELLSELRELRRLLRDAERSTSLRGGCRFVLDDDDDVDDTRFDPLSRRPLLLNKKNFF